MPDLFPGSAPEDPTSVGGRSPDGYGAGTEQRVENPDWLTWNSQTWAVRKQYGTDSPEYQAAMANEPPRFIQTSLGTDVQNIRDQGAVASGQISDDANKIRAAGAGTDAAAGTRARGYQQDADGAQVRGGPQMEVQGNARAQQESAGQAAANFDPNDAGAQGIRNAGQDAAARIDRASAQAAEAVGGTGRTRADQIAGVSQQGAAAVGGFRAAKSGIAALDKFAQGPAGPSAASAQLRMQADRDKRTALALARSARGGPAAVALALRRAQAENAATSAETRGQGSILRATEAATERGQNLSALQASGQLQQTASGTDLQAIQGGAAIGLQGATSAGQLDVNAQTAAGNVLTEGQIAAGNIAVGSATSATGAELQGSDQQLRAIGVSADIANNVRSMDIDTAKAQLGADLQTIAMNDEQTRFFAGLGEQARQAGAQARADALKNGLNADVAASQTGLQYATQAWAMLTSDQQAALTKMGIERGVIAANQQNAQAQSQQQLQFFGTLLMAGGMAASDRRVKKAITKLRGIASDLRKTPGHEWTYKDGKKHGEGRYTGAMAQDLESTRTFRSAVKNVNGTKIIDGTRLAMSQQGALHDLQKQIDRLSGLVKRKKGDASPDGKRA